MSACWGGIIVHIYNKQIFLALSMNYTWAASWQKDPKGIYEWQSPRPVCTASHLVKIFAISTMSSTRPLYIVGEQQKSWPDCTYTQSGLDLHCSHVLRSLFSAAGPHELLWYLNNCDKNVQLFWFIKFYIFSNSFIWCFIIWVFNHLWFFYSFDFKFRTMIVQS